MSTVVRGASVLDGGSGTPWELSLRPLDLVQAGASRLGVRLSDFHAEPGVVLVDGPQGEWEALADSLHDVERRSLLAVLRGLPAISIAIVRGAPGPGSHELITAFDLRALVAAERSGLAVNVAGDRQRVEDAVKWWRSGIARAPEAILVGTMVARAARDSSVETALVQESLGYGLLQASEGHRRWLRSRDPVTGGEQSGPAVVTEDHGSHTEVVLQRPERRNAFSARMRDDLYELLAGLGLGDDRPIVLRGAGPSFCAGGDLAEFGLVPTAMQGHLTRLGRSPARLMHDLRDRIVVGLHGACVGAGVELAAYASRVLAADDATFWLPEAGMGLLPGAGGTVSITRRSGSHRLVELLVTGERIGAMTARSWGLVDEVVPREDLEAALRRDARARASVSG